MTTQKELADAVALVTGAGSGIGRAAALALSAAGAVVGVLGRTQDELERVARDVEAQGGRAHVLVADVSKASDVKAAIERLVSVAGRLDVVFANAGVNGVWAPIEELEVEEWERTLAINLSGTFFTLKYAAPHLKRRGGAVIVCASVNGTRMFSNTGASAYSTSKAGQVALAKMLAVELAQHRVRVNVICPGAIETEIDDNTNQRNVERVKVPVEYPEGSIPLTHGAPGKAEQVADLVVFLAGPRSSHVSGTEVWIDGAQSLVEG